ncbi:homing endonuclease associated repeat-containing protein [Halorarum salinum]|uniref:HNH endonuclease n=1 Tax=Halorarum salinum TaxID=2743089 RepID=A0A7D5QAY3_9EURY|nr:HNH endonuclease [Halobaculum salinum]QLG60641.1 HNH endonuclease [Halobaculum salinum]
MDKTLTSNRLIADLRSFAEKVDGVPTVRGMRENGPHSPYYYKQEFGSWHDALRAADIQPTHGVEWDVSRERLLRALGSVDDIVDRPPRRADVEEHGEYPYILYDEEFESFVVALEEAGIDPDEKQYRFSSIETPEEKRGSANIEKLRNNGPTASTEMPQSVSTKDRQRGVWKFHVDSGSTNPSEPIYYLNGEHSPGLVIHRFFQQNPHVLEHRDPHGIKIAIRKHKPSWKGIGKEIVDRLLEQGVGSQRILDDLELEEDHSVQDLAEILRQVTEADLRVYSDDSELEKVKREKREAAFREVIYDLYDGCAICGGLIESPDGSHNLEAAHILPKAHGGPDLPQNGLALCSRHHWAFDHGWFELNEEYEISLQGHAELVGYDELKQYDGECLRVPSEKALQPYADYINQRNEGLDR